MNPAVCIVSTSCHTNTYIASLRMMINPRESVSPHLLPHSLQQRQSYIVKVILLWQKCYGNIAMVTSMRQMPLILVSASPTLLWQHLQIPGRTWKPIESTVCSCFNSLTLRQQLLQLDGYSLGSSQRSGRAQAVSNLSMGMKTPSMSINRCDPATCGAIIKI